MLFKKAICVTIASDVIEVSNDKGYIDCFVDNPIVAFVFAIVACI